jgi:hypothetical protein
MKGNGETDTNLLTGEIVGIYEKDNTRIAKVKYDSGFIDIPLKSIIQKVEEK